MSLIPVPAAMQAATRGFYNFPIEQSLRFNDDDSAHLSWYASTPTDGTRWTFSSWFKRSNLTNGMIFSAYNGTNTDRIGLDTSDRIHVEFKSGASTVYEQHTTAVLRDTSAWYHIVVVFNSNEAQADRVKIYLNGTQLTQFDIDQELTTSGYATTGINANGRQHMLGAYNNNGTASPLFDGYLAEVNFIDGQALTPDSFGELKNGVWIPKDPTELTYGTNGFRLSFADDAEVEAFNTVLYRGNGGTQSITGYGFDPDFVWIKNRSNAYNHRLYDKIRGNSRALQSNGSGKVEVSDVTTTELGYLDGVSSAIQTQLDAKQASDAQLTDIAGLTPTDSNFIVGDGSNFVTETGATARTSLGLGSIATQAANNVSISGGAVTGLGSPSANSDAATKDYVDQAVAGLRTRIIAECATTGNINLSNALEAGDAIDGVTLVAGDRVLVKDQSTASENGLYIAVGSGAGAASRDPEHDTIAELSGGMIVVNQGSVNDNKIFLCTTDNTGSVGSTSITYTVITPSNSGTVTQIGIADSGAGEFTVGNTPITSSGNITLAINSIADTKLGTIGTANKVSLTALNIDGGSDIGADLTTSDLIIVDDGAGGTNRKAALSRMITLVQANIDDPTALAIALG